MTTLLSPAQGLQTFERGAAAFLDTVRGADLTTPVPTCPGWTVADLVGHAAGIHLWARDAIRTGRPGDEPPPPADGRLDWYAGAAASLAATLRATDPEAECWHFGPKPRTARFWFRRQAHEIAVHLADARAAAGLRPDGLPDAAAVDGIDEVVTVFYPRQVRLGRIAPLAGGLTVRAGDATWTLGERPRASVTGPAGVVHLLLWGRIGLDDARLAVAGDPQVARAALTAGIVP